MNHFLTGEDQDAFRREPKPLNQQVPHAVHVIHRPLELVPPPDVAYANENRPLIPPHPGKARRRTSDGIALGAGAAARRRRVEGADAIGDVHDHGLEEAHGLPDRVLGAPHVGDGEAGGAANGPSLRRYDQ